MQGTLKKFGRPAALVLGALAFVALAFNALTSGQGPNPVSDVGAWTAWAGRDPVNALVMLVSALLAGFGAWGTVSNLINPNASREDLEQQSEQTREAVRAAGDGSAERDAGMAEHLRRLEAKLDAMGAGQGAALQTGVGISPAQTLATVAASTGPELAKARDAIRKEDPRAVVAALMETQGEDRRARLLEAAGLAERFDLRLAVQAYEAAMEIAPDVDNLNRLAMYRDILGDAAGARAAAKQALEAAGDDESRFTGLMSQAWTLFDHDPVQTAQVIAEADGLVGQLKKAGKLNRLQLAQFNQQKGNLALAQGQAKAARDHFKAALDDSRAYAGTIDDVEWGLLATGMLSERIADASRAAKDLPAERAARENALVSYNDLLERQADHQGALDGLGRVHHALGDLSILEEDEPSVALAAYRRAVAVRERLHAEDPGRTAWLTNLLESRRREMVALLKVGERDQAGASVARLVDLAAQVPDAKSAWLASLARSLGALGRTEQNDGRSVQAVAALEPSVAMVERMSAHAEDGHSYISIGYQPFEALLLARRSLGDPAGAVAAADRALGLYRILRSRAPDDADALRQQARMSAMKAEALEQAEDWTAAAAGFDEARSAFLAHAAMAPDDPESQSNAQVCLDQAAEARAKVK